MPDARRRPRGPRPSDSPPEPDDHDHLPTACLRPGDADRVLAGHPWVYEASILRLNRPPPDGEVIQVKDHRRRFLGIGFYNSRSKIRIRVLTHERQELDEAFFERRLRAALEHRRRHLPDATSFRLVNAEGDLLSGLIVDKYEDVLVLQTSSAGMERRKEIIVRVLQRLLSPRAIFERNDIGARKFDALPVRMNGLALEADIHLGHKTGLYLDQQVNQNLVAGFASGARVLDAFSFLGGFALHAARAGAASVIGVDQSADATAAARRLAAANGLGDRCSFETANVFDWLRARTQSARANSPEGGDPEPQFDLIILDPPSFTRNRASVPDALRGYKEIHLRALRLLRPGGVLATFCCSHHVDARTFEAVVREAALDARRQLRRLAIYTQAPDHPILPAVPETEYLKGFAFELLAP
jgi:23S rRNA (cytosine1962-C5)-methyltransferase